MDRKSRKKTSKKTTSDKKSAVAPSKGSVDPNWWETGNGPGPDWWRDRAVVVELYGPALVKEVETNSMGSCWVPAGHLPAMLEPTLPNQQVTWHWMYGFSETLGSVVPQIGGGWLASPFGDKSEHFSTLPAAMAFVEAHGTR